VREIEAADGEATFVRTDVTSEEQVAALIDAAVETYGGLDCAFNNAGREVNVGVADARPRTSKLRSTPTRAACSSVSSTRFG
jgi:NAD(P)-dependent dehydrogenase (short-subunit alcohol dehydrogenase family)